MAEIDLQRYADAPGITSLEGATSWALSRAKEASKHIPQLLSGYNHTPTGFLEIGPGVGGVTLAISTLYPNRKIQAIDCDSNPLIPTRMETNGVSFQPMKAEDIDSSFISNRQSQGINTIVGMRLPGTTIVYLVNLLSQLGFRGVFIGSIIALESGEEYYAMQQLARNPNVTVVSLNESRLIQEIGYVAHFP